MTEPLSPAAQAVMKAAAAAYWGEEYEVASPAIMAAAALRAAALVPNIDRLRLLALADELEGQG